MAATSKPVRKMEKKGEHPKTEYHSPKAAHKKVERLHSHMMSASGKHQQELGEALHPKSKKSYTETKKTGEEKLSNKAHELYKKVPKSMKDSPYGSKFRGHMKHSKEDMHKAHAHMKAHGG